jgi:hypothetical protein
MDIKRQATARICGQVISVGPRAIVGKSGKHKCELVIEASSNAQYPCPVKVEAYGDEISEQASGYAAGDWIEVEAHLRGREYQGKHYVSVSAWKIHAVDIAPAKVESEARQQAKDRTAKADNIDDMAGEGDSESMPF